MENRKLHIDQLYRDKEEQFASLPSAAWNAMDNKLGAKPAAGGSGSGSIGGIKPFLPSAYRWLWYVVVSASVVLITWQVLKPTTEEKKVERLVAENRREEEQSSELVISENVETVREQTAEENKPGAQITEETKDESQTNNKDTSGAETAAGAAVILKTITDRAKTKEAVIPEKKKQYPLVPQGTEGIKNQAVPVPVKNETAGQLPAKVEPPAKALPKQQMDPIAKHTPSNKDLKPNARPNKLSKKESPTVALNLTREKDDTGSKEGGPAALPAQQLVGKSKEGAGNPTAANNSPAKIVTQDNRTSRKELEPEQKTSDLKTSAVSPAQHPVDKSKDVADNTLAANNNPIKGEPVDKGREPQEKENGQKTETLKISAASAVLPPDHRDKDVANNTPAADNSPAKTETLNNSKEPKGKETLQKTGKLNSPTDDPRPGELVGNTLQSTTAASDNMKKAEEPAARKSRKDRKRETKVTAAAKPPAEKESKLITKTEGEPLQADKKEKEKKSSDITAAAGQVSGNTRLDLANSPSPGKTDGMRIKPFFEYGFKAGYEMGFGSDALGRLLAAPYLQYNFSDRFSVSIQPGIRYGAAKTTPVPEGRAYFQPTGTTYDSQMVQLGGLLRWQYNFRHHYDSIAVSYEAGSGARIEFEVPLILRYEVTERFAMTAGANFIRGKLPSLSERKLTYNDLVLTDTVLTDPNTPVGGPVDTSFIHTAQPYSEYTPFTGGMPASDPLRIGYMVGVQYTRRRWILELNMLQQVSGLNNITDQRIKKRYAQPYFRLMLGIRFGK